jgi:hemerythrin-like metal-binding protein
MSEIAWNDQLLNHHPQMDATHREFVDHLTQVQSALGQPDDVLLARYDALVTHTIEHFAQEDRWMKDLGFTEGNCHSSQHTQVLAVLHEVRRQHVEAGQTDLMPRLLPELMNWFENHAQAADAGLAAYMDEVGYDVASGVMTNPPREAAEQSGCGSTTCSS